MQIEFLNTEIKNIESKITCEASKNESVKILMSMTGIDYFSAMNGISNSYYRATENEVLEDYLKAVEVLTISQENKLIFENQQMKIHGESIQREKDELNLLRKQLAPLLELKNTLIE
jgi:hypothetical protein